MLLKRSLILAAALGLGLFGDVGCKDKGDTKTPDNDEIGSEEKDAPSSTDEGPSEANEDDFVSYTDPGEEIAEGEVTDEEGKKIEKPEPKEVCKGKGKKRTCKMVDPNPGLSAMLGVKALTKGYKWGMTPEDVIAVLAKDIDKEYKKRQKKANDPMSQDRLRAWKKEQLSELKKGHIKFTSSSRHKWGVSLIQFDFEDDNGEEMVWTRDNTLRKFFFFKDGELWKIVYAFNVEKWPGQDYEKVVEGSFKTWFGINPESKLKTDPKDARPLLRYYEWKAEDTSRIRSFDQSPVHGVFVLSVVNGTAEDQIGERLPNIGVEEKFSSDVGDVLTGSDVKYDENGNIVEGKPPEEEIE
ncbi:MAG: hypothetical protein H6713_23160 [Myxococcales bacterium]|nr:hypothetical protein [Myxococcales bacterium]MCB9752865.1 hypothetical protein [Myxococcales bacterium]